MFFCLRECIIRTQRYSQRTFHKSVGECNNYNIITVSSIPSVGTFRNSAFFFFFPIYIDANISFDYRFFIWLFRCRKCFPKTLHNAHKSGIITSVTPDQQEIQFADYDNQSISTHAVFKDYEIDEKHRHCRPFLFTFSAFILEVSDLGMKMYIKTRRSKRRFKFSSENYNIIFR